MESRDRDEISRVLEAALASLKQEAYGDERPANLRAVTSIRLPSNDAQRSGAPVVILIHPNSSVREATSTGSAIQSENPTPCGCSQREPSLHSEPQRFPLRETASSDPSKMCFIEPDRVCVASGACEALGY